MESSILALDIGQSGSRWSVYGVTQSISRGMFAGEPIEDTVGEIASLIDTPAEIVALSLTGLYGDVGDVSRFLTPCIKHLNAKKVAVIDDGLANLAGALRGKPGVALTLGGGVVAVGGNGDLLSHSDGLSSHFGDEGSGFWLGTRGLTRALATRDQRDEEFELMEIYKDQIEEYDSLKTKNGAEAGALAINSAQKLLEAADQGITKAIEIREEGAQLLAKTLVSAWRKVGQSGFEFSFTISGGLSKNLSYCKSIEKYVLDLEPNSKWIPAAGDNLSGALWIAENLKEDIRPMLGWARV
jgi:glucosamine kinase